MTFAKFTLAIGFLLAATTNNAWARGSVLDLQDGKIHISLGHSDGVVIGSKLILQHVIRAPHPVTKKMVRDTFPLGEMLVVNAGEKSCVAQADPALLARIRIGDEVTLQTAPVTFQDPWLRSAPILGTGNEALAEQRHAEAMEAAELRVEQERAVVATWHGTLGRPLPERIEIWKTYLTNFPQSPFRTYAQQVIGQLTARIVKEEELKKTTPEVRRALAAMNMIAEIDGKATREGDRLVTHEPTRVYEGEAIPFVLAYATPEELSRVWLYVRTFGESSYRRQEMVVDGDGYLRATVKADEVLSPSVQYFVEAQMHGEERPREILGSDAYPRLVVVDESVEEDPPSMEGHSRVSVFVDYVDFDGPGQRYDEYLHSEIDFMYRFFQPIYSLRMGFGSMNGTGGPKDVIDLDEGCTANGEYLCKKVGYNYAYTEIEKRFTDLFSLMLRVQWGSAYLDSEPEEGQGREFFDAFGYRARMRIGREQATNLVLGSSTTQRLGKMYEAAFTWDVIPKFPVVLSVEVTDRPVLQDFGVRLISDVGWRHYSWVYPSIRVAYQARDVDHAGLSAGFAANFDW